MNFSSNMWLLLWHGGGSPTFILTFLSWKLYSAFNPQSEATYDWGAKCTVKHHKLLFLYGWGFAWSEPSPLQRILHFRIFSFVLKVRFLEAVKGSVDIAVHSYQHWIAHLRARHFNSSSTRTPCRHTSSCHPDTLMSALVSSRLVWKMNSLKQRSF